MSDDRQSSETEQTPAKRPRLAVWLAIAYVAFHILTIVVAAILLGGQAGCAYGIILLVYALLMQITRLGALPRDVRGLLVPALVPPGLLLLLSLIRRGTLVENLAALGAIFIGSLVIALTASLIRKIHEELISPNRSGPELFVLFLAFPLGIGPIAVIAAVVAMSFLDLMWFDRPELSRLHPSYLLEYAVYVFAIAEEAWTNFGLLEPKEMKEAKATSVVS